MADSTTNMDHLGSLIESGDETFSGFHTVDMQRQDNDLVNLQDFDSEDNTSDIPLSSDNDNSVNDDSNDTDTGSTVSNIDSTIGNVDEFLLGVNGNFEILALDPFVCSIRAKHAL